MPCYQEVTCPRDDSTRWQFICCRMWSKPA